MFAAIKCPKCKASQIVSTQGMVAGQRMKCLKCKRYFDFVPPEEAPEKAKKSVAAVGEFLGDAAVRIGLVDFIDRIRRVVPGFGLVFGFCAFVGLAFFLVGRFAPEGPRSVGGIGPQNGPAADNPSLAADPIALHLSKLKDPDRAVRAQAARALGGLGVSAEQAMGDLLVLADERDADLLSAVDQALQGIGAPDQEHWVWVTRALHHKAKPPRAWALRLLAEPANATLEEMPRVIDTLSHADAELHGLAAKALDNFRNKDRDKVVARLFQDKSLSAKLYVTQALAEPGQVKLKDLPALITCLNERQPELRKSTIQALDNYPQADRPEVLLTLANDQRAPAHLYVANYLAQADSMVVPETVPRLIDWLSAPDKDLRKQSALALANFGPENFSSISDQPKLLTKALEHTAKPAKTWALKLLTAPDNNKLIELPRVIDCLSDADQEVSRQAAKTLDHFMEKDRGAVITQLFEKNRLPAKLYLTRQLAEPGGATLAQLPALAKFISDPDPALREQTAKVLGNFPEKDRQTVLLTLARELDPGPRIYVATELAKPAAKVIPETMPTLLDWLSAPSAELRQQAALALTRFGPKHAEKIRVPLLRFVPRIEDAKLAPALFAQIQALGPTPRANLTEVKLLTASARPDIRVFGWELLAAMDLNPPEIDQLFPPLIKEMNPRLREVGLGQLVKLGKEAAPYLSDVKILTEDRDLAVRRKAYESLIAMAPQQGLTPSFLKAAQDKDAATVRLAGLGLAKMPPLDKEQLSLILEFLKHEEPALRIAAARNLALLGKDGAGSAQDLLVKSLKDEETAVRIHATRALAELGQQLPGLAGFRLTAESTAAGPVSGTGRRSVLPSMTRFGEHYYAACRAGKTVKEGLKQVVVVRSAANDLKTWETVAHFESAAGEPPQLLVLGKRLHLAWSDGENHLSTSADGLKWTEAKTVTVEFPKTSPQRELLVQRQRFFRLRVGPDGACYCLARCGPAGHAHLLLLRSQDGTRFVPLHAVNEGLDGVFDKLGREPLDADLAFLETGTLVAAIRTDTTGLIAFGDAPFLRWQTFDSGVKDFAGPSLWASKQGLLLAVRAPAKDGSACTVFSVTPTSLVRTFAVKCGEEHGHACLTTGPAEEEVLLVCDTAREGEGPGIVLHRLKIRAGKIAALDK